MRLGIVRHVAAEPDGKVQRCARCGAALARVPWWRRLLRLPPFEAGETVSVDTGTGEIVDAPGRRCG